MPREERGASPSKFNGRYAPLVPGHRFPVNKVRNPDTIGLIFTNNLHLYSHQLLMEGYCGQCNFKIKSQGQISQKPV